jgi:hypothetical protein
VMHGRSITSLERSPASRNSFRPLPTPGAQTSSPGTSGEARRIAETCSHSPCGRMRRVTSADHGAESAASLPVAVSWDLGFVVSH